jgi:multidrug efflux pump subunit AcrA (membrane-fusion protein)
VPSNAVVRLDGKPGVFVADARSGAATGSGTSAAGTAGRAGGEDKTLSAKFVAVEPGINDGKNVEIVSGLGDGARVITTGAGALKDGDRIVAANTDGGRRGSGSDQGAPGAPQRGSR